MEVGNYRDTHQLDVIFSASFNLFLVFFNLQNDVFPVCSGDISDIFEKGVLCLNTFVSIISTKSHSSLLSRPNAHKKKNEDPALLFKIAVQCCSSNTIHYFNHNQLGEYIFLYNFLATHPNFMKVDDFSENLSGINILKYSERKY